MLEGLLWYHSLSSLSLITETKWVYFIGISIFLHLHESFGGKYVNNVYKDLLFTYFVDSCRFT